MDPLEEKLAEMKLTAPSDRLDARIDETFRAARIGDRRTRKVGFLWWVGAMTAVGAVAAVLLRAPQKAPQVIGVAMVYRIEAQTGLRDMLLNSAANQAEPTHFELRTPPH